MEKRNNLYQVLAFLCDLLTVKYIEYHQPYPWKKCTYNIAEAMFSRSCLEITLTLTQEEDVAKSFEQAPNQIKMWVQDK